MLTPQPLRIVHRSLPVDETLDAPFEHRNPLDLRQQLREVRVAVEIGRTAASPARRAR
ncbi:MAG: hypothetical protein MUF81_12380 [Verrucomicrobia bacterium]|nr:hypothetical protein [Verrucomicrobiota bacterium]